jgi:tyrosine-protein kinase Etk/Wzc
MQRTENTNLEPRTTNCSTTSPGLLDYLAVILKHRVLIFRITLAATVITAIYTLFLPNIYTAKTLILPAQEDRGMVSAMMSQMGGLATLAGGMGASIGSPTTTDLYVSMLKCDAVKDPIIGRFKLLEIYSTKYRTDASAILDKNSTISAGKKDGIITIAVSDKDPKRAAAMANAYVDELGRLAVSLNVTGASQNGIFLEERLARAKTDLANAEDNLKSFQGKYKAINVTAQTEATIKGVAELRAQLAAQEVQLATYRRQFTDSSQEVKNLTTSVGNLRRQIAKLEGVEGDSAMPSVGSVPTIGQEYVRLMREFKIQESLVELLTKQYEMTKLSEAKDISPFQVIQKASIPERKSKPSRIKMVMVSVVLSLLGSCILALMLEIAKNLPDAEKARWKKLFRRS